MRFTATTRKEEKNLRTVPRKVRQRPIFESVRNTAIVNNLLTNTSNHLWYVIVATYKEQGILHTAATQTTAKSNVQQKQYLRQFIFDIMTQFTFLKTKIRPTPKLSTLILRKLQLKNSEAQCLGWFSNIYIHPSAIKRLHDFKMYTTDL